MKDKITREELGSRIVKASRITGEFLLRSGATSNVYFDKYRFESDPELLWNITAHLAELIPEGTERLVGLEMGGIPLATALSLHTGIAAGFCRKRAKEYGTQLQLEGGVGKGEKVAIIEDVVTSGGAAIEAVEVMRDPEMNIEIMGLLCVVDREAGAKSQLWELGIDFKPLFTWTELDEYIEQHQKMDQRPK